MEERDTMEKIIDELIDDVHGGDTIATKEIQEIQNPEDREYEHIPEELKNQGGI